MYPMGGMNVGGMNVGGRMMRGGMNVGGMNVGGALPAKGTQAYADMRAKAQRTRASKSAYLESLAQQFQREGGLSKRDAKAMAKIQLAQDTLRDEQQARAERVSVPRASRKGQPRAPLTPLGEFLLPLRNRLTVKNAKDKKFNLATADPAKVIAVANALSAIGLGIHDLESGQVMDMEGGAWYDDIASGFKSVISTAAPFLPLLL